MTRRARSTSLLVATLLPALLVGCTNQDDGDAPAHDGAADTGAKPDGGVSETIAQVPAHVGLAVINGDYQSVSVSLVNPGTGALTRDACITSGSKAPKLTAALSGDVVLPTQAQAGNELVLIDRTQAALTWLDAKTCEVLRQLNVGMGFRANPHDVISVAANKAYVTRYDANPARPDQGSDLLVIDPSVPAVLHAINLLSWAAPSGPRKPIWPAPERGVVLNGLVYVVLNNVSTDYSIAGAGRVITVDPTSDAVIGAVDLPGLHNCTQLTPVENPRGLVVSCAGLFTDGPKQIEASGVAWIDLSGAAPAVKVISATAFGRSVSGFELAMLTSSVGFAITSGDFKGPPFDQLWRFDFAGGTPTKVMDGTSSFTFGGLTIDRTAHRLFLADAQDKTPLLHVFDVMDPSKPMLMISTRTSATGLPPRSATLY